MNFKSLNYNNFIIDDVLDTVAIYRKKKKKKAKKKHHKNDGIDRRFEESIDDVEKQWAFESCPVAPESPDPPPIPISEFGFKGKMMEKKVDFPSLGKNCGEMTKEDWEEFLKECEKFPDAPDPMSLAGFGFVKDTTSNNKKSKFKKSKSNKKPPLVIG